MRALHRMFSVLTIVMLCAVTYVQSVAVSDAVWKQYKLDFFKTYPNSAAESNARYYYAYNLNMITTHNLYADKGKYTYRLAPNQFTDMRLITFNALFPQTTQPLTSNAIPLPVPSGHTIPITFDPRISANLQLHIRDQGVSCSSGWANAVASSLDLRDSLNWGQDTPPLSSQQLLDCAPIANGCVGQVPQTAFDYLTKYRIVLTLESGYPSEPESSTSLPCRLKTPGGYPLLHYSQLANGNEAQLRTWVSDFYPVVTEFDPTSFEYMHYASGIFTQPATNKGSHFMLVIGYDAESWILQNSFGTKWGERGFMRLKRNDAKALLPKSGTLPID